ncbi:FMN reductase [Streptomyces sp. NPDC051018]|uniref:FMN reductase n=1 Tax=Streptomyces sp. NPDC051018 TaxID=3365639 RepID=UPI00379D1AE6
MTMTTRKLVAVSAGLSVPSSTRLLADRLTEAVRGSLGESLSGTGSGAGTGAPAGNGSGAPAGDGVEVRVVELRELAVPIANHLVTGFPSPDLEEAIDAVTEADGLIAVTPVFTASYSGLFKSFFDLIEPEALSGKPVLIGATGGTARHSLVLEHALRPLFAYLRALVVPTAVYAASEDWGGSGDPLTDTLPVRISRAGEQLARLMTGTRGAGDTAGAGAAGFGAGDFGALDFRAAGFGTAGSGSEAGAGAGAGAEAGSRAGAGTGAGGDGGRAKAPVAAPQLS